MRLRVPLNLLPIAASLIGVRRQFYLTYRAKVQTLSGQFDAPFPLPWSHHVRLLAVTDDTARDYYEHEVLRGGWSVWDLDRPPALPWIARVRDRNANIHGSVIDLTDAVVPTTVRLTIVLLRRPKV